ncbi:hypothetical protein [Streptomyces sp. NPDC045251]
MTSTRVVLADAEEVHRRRLVEKKPGRFTLPASEQGPGAGRPGGGP